MGVIFAITSAFSVAAQGVFLKRLSGASPNFLTWVRAASAVPVLALLISVFSAWAVPPLQFWVFAFLLKAPLEITLAWFGTKAMQISPISLVAPLGTLTSIFLIPMGYFFLGELPTAAGLAGVLLIAIGSFFLGWRIGGGHFFAGIKNVLRDHGSVLAVVGAALASGAITVTKTMFHFASPLQTAFYSDAVIMLALTPLLFNGRNAARGAALNIAGVGLMSGAGSALHNVGLSLMPAVYFISVKRLSVVIDVICGRIFFGEDHIRERMIGAIMMVAGVAVIALA